MEAELRKPARTVAMSDDELIARALLLSNAKGEKLEARVEVLEAKEKALDQDASAADTA
jgi:BMFP domain-containing protein YqiC